MKKTSFFLIGTVLTLILMVACGSDPFFHHVKVVNGSTVISEKAVFNGEKFTFPDAPEGSTTFSHWKTDRSDDIYHPGDEIEVYTDLVITAVNEEKAPSFSVDIPAKMSNTQTIAVVADDDVEIHYTLDGSDPKSSATAKEGREISLSGLSGEITVKVAAVRKGVWSDTVEKKLTVVEAPAKPVVTGIEDTSVPVSQSLTLKASEVSGTTVRYTFDGTAPTSTTAAVAEEGVISLSGQSGNVTLKIARFDSDGFQSEVLTLTLKVKPVTPSSDAEDNSTLYDTDKITIPSIEGAAVSYTTDGSDPFSSTTAQSGNEISLTGLIGSDRKIRVVAVKDGVASDELSLTITVKHAPFSFSTDSGKLSNDAVIRQDGVITADVTEGAVVYYTLDGKDPTSSSTRADGRNISVAGSSGKTIVKAYASINGSDTDVASIEIIVCPPAPVSTLEENAPYSRTGTITLSFFTGDGTLRYTLDGSAPTAASPEIPSTGIPLTGLTGKSAKVTVVSEKDGAVSEGTVVTVTLCDYSLSYDLSGGEDSDSTNTAPAVFNKGDTVTFASSNSITKEGYIFDGWYSGEDYYEPSSSYEIESEGDITLTAKWIVKGAFKFTQYTDKDTGEEVYMLGRGDSVPAEITIPAKYKGKKVAWIDDGGYAFKDLTTLTKVEFELPSNLTSIGGAAFNACTGLTEFTIPDSVDEIDSSAFFECKNLTTVNFPSSDKCKLTEIASDLFYETALESVTLPDTITTIYNGGFYRCKNLESINLSKVKTIDKLVFYECSKLKSVDLAEAETIGDNAFENCSALETVNIGSNITAIGENAFKGTPSSLVITIDRSSADSESLKSPWGATGTIIWNDTICVTFDSDGGSTVAIAFPDTEGKVAQPSSPTKEGFFFAGWLKADGTAFDFDNDTVTESITLKAKWVTQFSVGDRGPAGGIVFYVADEVQKSTYLDASGTSVEYEWKYLEAAPADTGVAAFGVWSYTDEDENDYYIRVEGTGDAVGTGRYNTTKLIKSMGGTAAAASLCDSYTYGGFDDWFLPSKGELELMYSELKAKGKGGTWADSPNVSPYLVYWSSTEDNSDSANAAEYAWTVDFDNGESSANYVRYNDYNVRAVRAFK